jgi:glutamate 5-kinase (EC 2.7.2.11)
MADHLQLRGWVMVDEGAARRLRAQGASLLPVGVVEVQGDFDRGDVIAVRDASGAEVARGLSNYAASQARRIMRHPSADIEAILGFSEEPELITGTIWFSCKAERERCFSAHSSSENCPRGMQAHLDATSQVSRRAANSPVVAKIVAVKRGVHPRCTVFGNALPVTPACGHPFLASVVPQAIELPLPRGAVDPS